ncbi:MAG: 2-hydroxyacyl-CoA dehydratase [bacterium]|nr:2-hydroxyacyl-CoA dehydratase [bacterium]
MKDPRLGITATVPSEVALAAGRTLVDLNNVRVRGESPERAVREAESAGFPRNSCAWIKGVYATIRRLGLSEVVGVSRGDCSNTEALLEILADDGLAAVPFAYPESRSPEELSHALERFADRLGTSLGEAEQWRERLAPIREDLGRLDGLVVEGKRRDAAYFNLALSASDWGGDLEGYAAALERELASGEEPPPASVRLAYLGVPPAFTDLLARTAELGAAFVFAEIPRQFTMPGRSPDLVAQYLAYTYPYGMAFRLGDILPKLEKRRVDGVVHYVQSFCFRQIEDILLRRRLPSVPVLTLEGDRPGPLTARDLLRLESFVETLLLNKPAGGL